MTEQTLKDMQQQVTQPVQTPVEPVAPVAKPFTIPEPEVVQEPIATPIPVEQVKDTQQPSSDLMSRVTRFQADNKPVEPSQINDNSNEGFDLKEIEAIADPIAKEQAMNAYKSFQRGFNKKYQELAELRKALQANLDTGNKQEESWTRDRIQTLINDPQFVKAAQEFQGTQEPDDDYSSLSEVEKTRLSTLEKELFDLKKSKEQNLETQRIMERQRQHEQYSQKYANYKSDEVDALSLEIASGKLQTTPEHIYKAFKHDENCENAYQMGLRDAREGITEKAGVLSIEGQNTYRSDEPVVRQQGESSKAVWARCGQNALAKLSSNTSIKR